MEEENPIGEEEEDEKAKEDEGPPPPPPPPSPPGYFSVWAELSGVSGMSYDPALHSVMTQLKEQHASPSFSPHVTVMGLHWSEFEIAKSNLKALCASTLPFTFKVTGVESGETYHQCVYLLMKKTEEVVNAHVQALTCFNQLTPDSNLDEIREKYKPHMSLMYCHITDEGLGLAKAKVEAEYGKELLGREYHITHLSLWLTDVGDESCLSWKRVAEFPLQGVPLAPPPGFFSVWAELSGVSGMGYDPALHLVMTQLREQHAAPSFSPHVTVMGLHWSEFEVAESNLKALCASTLPFTLKVTGVEIGETYHHCVYLLMEKTKEVVNAHVQALTCFNQLTPDSNLDEIRENYKPHMSLMYCHMTDEELDLARAKVEAEHGIALFGREYHITHLSLWLTDVDDESCLSWKRVAEFPLKDVPLPPPPGFFSVWAELSGVSGMSYDPALHSVMTQLKEQHAAPSFSPHVTMMGLHWSEFEVAESNLKALCASTLPFTLKVTGVESGETYHQCVYLLMEKTEEVVSAHVQALACFNQLTPDSNLEYIKEKYKPHMSLMYCHMTDEQLDSVKAKVEAEYGKELLGREYHVTHLSLWLTDVGDESCLSWKRVATLPLKYVPPPPPPGFFSVWAELSSVFGMRCDPALHLVITQLKEQHAAPSFSPHVTVMGAHWSEFEVAENNLKALCASTLPFTVKVTGVDSGKPYHQCVYLLMEKTEEVVNAHVQALTCFNQITPDSNLNDIKEKYKPHMSLMYCHMTDEELDLAKATVEAEYGKELFGREFHITHLSLWLTDVDDEFCLSWKRVATLPLKDVEKPNSAQGQEEPRPPPLEPEPGERGGGAEIETMQEEKKENRKF